MEGLNVAVVVMVVGMVVESVVRSWCLIVTVVGTVDAMVARSCMVMVKVVDALVMVVVSVTVTVTELVTVDGSAFPSAGPAVLGDGVFFAAPAALGVGSSIATPVRLGVGRSLTTGGTGIPADGMSLPAAGTLGFAVSFPPPLAFPFFGESTDPKDPKIERGRSLIVAKVEDERLRDLDDV